jgi:serine/threonine protein phosphatase 1
MIDLHETSNPQRKEPVGAADLAFVAGVDPNCSLDEQDPQDVIWKIYDDRDEGGHGQRHIVHGHHQHADGPILKKNRTNLDTFAWYIGRLVIGVFDDDMPGGPLEILEVQGPSIRAFRPAQHSS